ncbi:hypothetical protein PC9H_008189 [Pleurotus ostreatus]|uniref:Uncharacterized protein n=1 Tax=Pleurotus ostreatus TaxID=5322 RepID=A0A8H6ZZM3_PLEOS|nr:uncharacterized protein PC9H_008189 [Pleurotus ostreatus]KAF7428952.1 hypothetical protein PC9H_008189 [Pleurotus ostreatus]
MSVVGVRSQGEWSRRCLPEQGPCRRVISMASLPPSVASAQNFTLPEIPELYRPDFLDVLVPAPPVEDKAAPQSVKSNPMMSALQSIPTFTFTQNGAPTFNTTGSPTLDAFQFVKDQRGSALDILLCNSWKEDPALTLRVIWNLRSIRDGKGDREGFYRAFGWLYKRHPRTAISNLRLLVEPVCENRRRGDAPHGCWKDLLNIIALETVDELSDSPSSSRYLHCPRDKYTYPSKGKGKASERESRIEAAKQANLQAKARAQTARAERAMYAHQQIQHKLSQPKYRALFIAIARLFADRLVKDLQLVLEADHLPAGVDRILFLKQLSFAGKWAPTPGLSHDRVTNIASAISLLIQAANVFPLPSVLSDPSSSLTSRERLAILRSFYQRWVLTPLRSAGAVAEPLMAANRWTDIKYFRTTSSHTIHTASRTTSCESERANQNISGATLMPHEIVAELVFRGAVREGSSKKQALYDMKKRLAKAQIQVLEAQWKTLVDSLREAGSLDNCIAVCDVSGSMGSISEKLCKETPQPIFPAVALSLILAQLAKPPFNGFITFADKPKFVSVDPSWSVYDSIQVMSRSEWGMNTNFYAVFVKLLLPLALKNKIKQEDMIKRIFVFSDMQFDSAQRGGNWETTHDLVAKAYKEAGYEVPQIVYWDLAAFGTVEVRAQREGVAIMNGFSPAMLKVFMGEEEEKEEAWEEVNSAMETSTLVEQDPFNPLAIMNKALGKKSFQHLVVVD